MNEEKLVREKIKVGTVENKSVQEKKKKRVVTVCGDVYEEIKKLSTKCNDKRHGGVVSSADVIKYAIQNLKEADIKMIQEQSLTLKDKIEIEHYSYNEKMNVQHSLEEFIAIKLKIQ